nr:ATP-binding cassette domain-containing protein [uncultured Oscillibacter sp.]
MELRVENLCKSYNGVPVLQNVSFTAGNGVTCVMAPSGAGKTTLLRILLGLERPDGGAVSGAEGCRWAAVFQEDRLLEHLDAMDNLRFVLGRGLDVPKASALLEELGLGDVGEKPVRVFSGGMKRRLALARALLAASDALALDEPFAGLDGENRERAIACVRRAGAEKPVLLVTHDAGDAVGLAAKIFRL